MNRPQRNPWTTEVTPPMMDSESVSSPCVRNCCLDPEDVCLGCGRTLAEITGWSEASDSDKKQIKALAAARVSQRQLGLVKPNQQNDAQDD